MRRKIENAGGSRRPPIPLLPFCHRHHHHHHHHHHRRQQKHNIIIIDSTTSTAAQQQRQHNITASKLSSQQKTMTMEKGHHPTGAGKSNSKPTSSSPPLKTTASSKLYVTFIGVLFFCLATFLLVAVTQPDNHTNHPQHQRQKALDEFLDSGKPIKGTRPFTGITITSAASNTSNSAVAAVAVAPPYHMVFSTSCTDQQHWESYVFYYHALKVQQPGTITRIASGCKPGEAAELQTFHDLHIQPMSPHFHLHMTPDFSKVLGADGKYKVYKYMNKPFGLHHWMEVVLKMNETTTTKDPKVDDGIIMLLDPDMILLRPLVHDFTQEDVIFVEENPATRIVKHGLPISQQDGYMSNKWMDINVTHILDGGALPEYVTRKSASIHWNTGPPYLATVRDMYRIAERWTFYAPRVLDVHVGTFSEMFGFILSTTQLNLPHTMIKSIVVSTTIASHREGWSYIDAIPEEHICSPPSPSTPLPVGLHYCGRYLLEKWFFSKYRLKKKYISCETPFLTPPPNDLATRGYDFWLQPPPHGHKGKWEAPKGNIGKKQAKREAYMICGLIRAVNEAARYFKEHACNGTANMEENYNFHDDPHHR